MKKLFFLPLLLLACTALRAQPVVETIPQICSFTPSHFSNVTKIDLPLKNNMERLAAWLTCPSGGTGSYSPPIPTSIPVDSLCHLTAAKFRQVTKITLPLVNNTEALLCWLVCNQSGGGSGTVTSVATGFGLKGGTITTTGTLYADTTRDSGLPTYYYVDSLYNTITPIVYIDSLWRTPGVDSIYFSKNGNTYSIKDSAGIIGTPTQVFFAGGDGHAVTSTKMAFDSTMGALRLNDGNDNVLIGKNINYYTGIGATIEKNTMVGTETSIQSLPGASNSIALGYKAMIDKSNQFSVGGYGSSLVPNWKINGVDYVMPDDTAEGAGYALVDTTGTGQLAWKEIPTIDTTHFWNTNGNSGTNSGVNFIGTTDNASLEFRVNDTTAMFIDSSNRHVGIGTVTPDADAMLHVEGLTPLYLHGSIPSVIEGSFSFGLKTTTAANGYDYQNGYVIDNYLNDETGINAYENHGVGNAGAFVQGVWINSTGSPRSYKKYYPTGDANYGIDTSYKVNYVYDNSNLYFPDYTSSANFLDNSSSVFQDNSSSNFYDTSSANFFDNSSLVLNDSSTFQFATGSEGEHKVLTSDAFGFATWQPLNRDTVFVPTTSSTDTLQDGYTGAILDAGATGITGYTLTMPPNPYEGQRILVSLADGTTFGMGYFTVDGNGSPVKANYMMVNNVQYTFRYKNGTWY